MLPGPFSRSLMCLWICIAHFFLKSSRLCVCRSHRSEYEVSRPELLLLQLQQPRSGGWRRWSLGSAQPSGGHSGEAAHRRIPGVRRLPAPLSGRAGEPDPAAELSPSQTLWRDPLLACPSLSLSVTHVWADLHTKTQMYTSDTAAHSGSCRYGTFTYSHMFMYLDGPERITG